MDYLTVAVGLFFAWGFVKCLNLLGKTQKKLPPGPTPLPIIGNLHLLGDQFHKTLTKLAEHYGPIMLLKFGRVPTVIISSPAAAREVLQKQDQAFSGKRVPDALHALDHYKYSVVWLPTNNQWRTLRRILTSNIFTNNRLQANQHLRLRKVQELIEYVRKSSHTGEAVEIGEAAFRTSLNLLSNTIFSKDLSDHYSDTASAREFKDAVWNILVESAKPNLVDFFPILKRFDPQGVRRRSAHHFSRVLKIFDALMDERLEQRRSEGNPKNNDVLDIFLNYIEENPGELDRNHVKRTCLDLFIAGVDTSASIVEWAMSELLKNPEIMKKVKDELDEVIGKENPVQESDIARLPYLGCVVKETLRIHPPGPFLFPRTSEEDVEVCGYIIPKHSQVLVSIRAIGRDPSLWKDPLEFKPERFANSEVDVRGHNFELLPFGSGRRTCPGLPLATRMVPLMVGSLVKEFNWKLEGGLKPQDLDMEEKVGLTLQKLRPLKAVPMPL